MKKLILTLLATALIAGALATSAVAAEIEVTGDAYVAAYSKYVWRGFDLSQDDRFVVQGGTDLTFGGFTVGFWGNMSENTGELNEVDVVLDYSTDLGEIASISVGNILYDVDNVGNDTNGDGQFETVGKGSTNELYLGLGLNVPLSPTATVYWDYDEFSAVYTTLGLSHDFEINDKLGLSVGATGSYAFDKTEWLHNLELSAGASYAVTDMISLDASALYSAPLTEKAKRQTGIAEEFTAGGGVTLAF